ncbi:MAG: M15 family metallopeptidase [Actinobacteria bacterium]|nr:M15 family metallopeptidase [Actinomycetota bacterium]
MSTYYSQGVRRRTVVNGSLGLLATVLAGSVAFRFTDLGPVREDSPEEVGTTDAAVDPATTRTPNGWPVLEAGGTRTVEAAGRSLMLRPGPAGLVLAAFVRRFHSEVEPVDRGTLDDWAYARRAVRGASTVWSEHAAGTAVDLNATTHVRGRSGTFSRAGERSVRRLLDDFDDVVGWGADFDTPDEMHFEIAVGPGSKRLERLARQFA